MDSAEIGLPGTESDWDAASVYWPLLRLFCATGTIRERKLPSTYTSVYAKHNKQVDC